MYYGYQGVLLAYEAHEDSEGAGVCNSVCGRGVMVTGISRVSFTDFDTLDRLECTTGEASPLVE